MKSFFSVFYNSLWLPFVQKQFKTIIEINRRYAEPKLKMTPFVRYSLLTLRFYLLFLVAILFYKFYTLVR